MGENFSGRAAPQPCPVLLSTCPLELCSFKCEHGKDAVIGTFGICGIFTQCPMVWVSMCAKTAKTGFLLGQANNGWQTQGWAVLPTSVPASDGERGLQGGFLPLLQRQQWQIGSPKLS